MEKLNFIKFVFKTNFLLAISLIIANCVGGLFAYNDISNYGIMENLGYVVFPVVDSFAIIWLYYDWLIYKGLK